MANAVVSIAAGQPGEQLATSREHWSSRMAFVLAAAGSAVGLGNVWKFPYIVGENGGGAFVIVYLVCIALIGLPIMMAEVLIGRRGGMSPIGSVRSLAARDGRSSNWQILGWVGVVGAFLILSFYSVVAGWAVIYLVQGVSGVFTSAAQSGDAAGALNALFTDMLGDAGTLISAHTIFMAATVAIVSQGIRAGLERAVRIMMPGLFLLLIILVAYAAITTDRFGQAVSFLFAPDFSALSAEAVLIALGHAFFTLSLGMGAMMAYGSYLPRHISIARASITVSVLDTLVALLAGLAIFPIVFAHTLEPAAGPGLVFLTLPVAFSEMQGGDLIGTLFFLFLAVAALTSSISVLEPAVEYLQERFGGRRPAITLVCGGAIWLLGIASALSFNAWSDIKLFGKTFFDLLDYLTANIMAPLSGLLIALFAGWVMSKSGVADELGMGDGAGFRLWRFVVRYIAPVGVAVVFIYNLF
jgi:NSS family neurotransmitter:Na+ symporter